MAIQGKRWVGTLFFDDESVARAAHAALPAVPDRDGDEFGQYGGGQLEICPTTGRIHLQFWCGFDHNQRFNRMKLLAPTAHWEVLRGTVEQAREYCSKAETKMPGCEYIEWGMVPENKQGKRNDLEAVVKTLRAAMGTVKEKVKAVAIEHGAAFIKNFKGVQVYAELMHEDEPPEMPVWRPWQLDLVFELAAQPDNRSIIWYYDPSGGAGKSTVVNYFTGTPDMKAILLEGKLPDMKHAFA